MKRVWPRQLEEQQPDLHKKIMKAYDMILPAINDMVCQTFAGQHVGSAALHATFLRIEDEETKEKYFTELQIMFIKQTGGDIFPQLALIVFHDTFEDYERERKKMIKEGVENYGNENFPTFTNFKGLKFEEP